MPQRKEEARKEGRRLEACRGVEPESRNELLCLYLNMKERGLLCLSDSKTKGCYLHGACLTLDYSEGEMTTVSFPSSPCSSLYRFFIPNSLWNKQSWWLIWCRGGGLSLSFPRWCHTASQKDTGSAQLLKWHRKNIRLHSRHDAVDGKFNFLFVFPNVKREGLQPHGLSISVDHYTRDN